jgi:hypothetical protein
VFACSARISIAGAVDTRELALLGLQLSLVVAVIPAMRGRAGWSGWTPAAAASGVGQVGARMGLAEHKLIFRSVVDHMW